MKFKTLKDIQSDFKDLKDKVVLLRLDFNVSIENGEVRDAYRIEKSIPTIQYLLGLGLMVVTVAHIESEEATLKPVYSYLARRLNTVKIHWCERVIEEGGELINKVSGGEIIFTENIRLYNGEKKNDKEFSKSLARLGDLYVNDAFSVSHRSHASIVGLPTLLKCYAGLQFENEVKELSTCFSPSHPFLFILGGAKFETKLPLIKSYLNDADNVVVGGALANTFYKESGMDIGDSLVSEGDFDTKSLTSTGKIYVPEDQVFVDNKIMDAGKKSVETIIKMINSAKFILWNGPLGAYEGGYKEPTLQLAKAIANRTDAGARSVVGGGDTIAAIAELKLDEKFSFISTAGGAMLDFLANRTLPGIKALEK